MFLNSPSEKANYLIELLFLCLLSKLASLTNKTRPTTKRAPINTAQGIYADLWDPGGHIHSFWASLERASTNKGRFCKNSEIDTLISKRLYVENNAKLSTNNSRFCKNSFAWFFTDNLFVTKLLQNMSLLVESFALFSTDNLFEISMSILFNFLRNASLGLFFNFETPDGNRQLKRRKPSYLVQFLNSLKKYHPYQGRYQSLIRRGANNLKFPTAVR